MGGAVAFFFFAMPMVLLEQGVIASGLPNLIAAAGPPLGATARTLVAGSFGLVAAGFTWAAITLAGLIGRPRRDSDHESDGWSTIPFHAEGAPDAPARRPIFASSELGAPLAEEQPLSLAEDDVLELVNVFSDEPPPPEPACQAPSIAELMARLEAGAERRAAQAASAAAPLKPSGNPAAFEGALRSALDDLKRMAMR